MQSINADLGRIFFTEQDDSITGTSIRDPLGLQPIWSYNGRRVIKHLTTVSTDIRGFREVLLCLSVCSTARNKKKDETYRDLILLFEQLFVYTAIEHNISAIIGADNGIGKLRAAGNDPIISSTDTILVREISLGYYGRYKTPLSTMGVIDRNSRVAADIDASALYGPGLYNKILESFEEFLKSDRRYKSFKAADELFEAVCGKFRSGEKEFWLSKLQIDGDNKNALMNTCYALVDNDLSCRAVFDEMTYAKEVRDIQKLEPFLRCMEYIFYKSLEAKNIKDVVIEDTELAEHKKRFEALQTVSDTSEAGSLLLDRRMNYIKKECVPGTEQYVSKIIAYHKLVCDQKRSSVWLEHDSAGNIQSFIQPEFRIIDQQSYIEEWGRNYYTYALRSIKNGLGELSQ